MNASKPSIALAFVCLVLFTLGGTAGAAPLLPIIQPAIVQVSSTAVCPVVPCALTATMNYNTAVSLRGNVASDFAVADLSNGSRCTVTSVTPSPVVTGGTTSLLLHATCPVQTGDTLSVHYSASTAAYVFNARYPKVHALSPQTVQWIEGQTTGCPPLCAAP